MHDLNKRRHNIFENLDLSLYYLHNLPSFTRSETYSSALLHTLGPGLMSQRSSLKRGTNYITDSKPYLTQLTTTQ
jgi:hypothetical protein